MARVLRGDIYWADLSPVRGREQGGMRPVLVLSHDVFNERSGTVMALAVTSQPQRTGYPLTWKIPAGVLPRESWVKCSQIRTLSTERLTDRLGRIDEDGLRELVDGLLELIG
ncbi:MAG: type II toxin-antitoxin system PemK/MazF family toxin [Chloroflexi bacterium]|nr:type II toxin-antitoxin system PemK/MazF family toxin [Chloroflexota bacterium]MBI4507224.1 type II toxin-antitoxin system PemK/MazF family toxin [Chloroflexota bacterium]